MTQVSTSPSSPSSDSYKSIRFALQHGAKLRIGIGVLTAATIGWIGMRTGIAELWLIGVGVGVAINYVAKVALEVLALVADTLVPQ